MLFMVINSTDCHIYQCIFLRNLVHEGAGAWLALYRKLLWYIQQGTATYSWQERNAQKHNQKWLRNPVCCEVRDNLFTVTTLSFVVHIHTLSCFLSSKQRSLTLVILIEQTLSVSTHTFYNGIKRREYTCHARVSLQLWSYRRAKLKKTQIKQKPPNSQNKTNPKLRGQAMEFSVQYTLKHSSYCRIINFFFTVVWSI